MKTSDAANNILSAFVENGTFKLMIPEDDLSSVQFSPTESDVNFTQVFDAALTDLNEQLNALQARIHALENSPKTPTISTSETENFNKQLNMLGGRIQTLENSPKPPTISTSGTPQVSVENFNTVSDMANANRNAHNENVALFQTIKKAIKDLQDSHDEVQKSHALLEGRVTQWEENHKQLKESHDALNNKFAEWDEEEDEEGDTILLTDKYNRIALRAFFKEKGVNNLTTLFIPVVPPPRNPENNFRAFTLNDGTFEINGGYWNNPGDMSSDPINQTTLEKIQEVDLYKKYRKTTGAVPLEVTPMSPTAPNPPVAPTSDNTGPGQATQKRDTKREIITQSKGKQFVVSVPVGDAPQYFKYTIIPDADGKPDGDYTVEVGGYFNLVGLETMRKVTMPEKIRQALERDPYYIESAS